MCTVVFSINNPAPHMHHITLANPLSLCYPRSNYIFRLIFPSDRHSFLWLNIRLTCNVRKNVPSNTRPCHCPNSMSDFVACVGAGRSRESRLYGNFPLLYNFYFFVEECDATKVEKYLIFERNLVSSKGCR